MKNTSRVVLTMAAALFLCSFRAVASSQASPPDGQNGSIQDESPQHLGTTDSPALEPDRVDQPPPAPEGPASVDRKIDRVEGKQTSRMFWVVPNFAAVSANTLLPPLSTKQKYALATQDSVDYSSFVWAGLIAGQSMVLKSDPELRQGLKGYGRYYWRAFADQASGSFFTEAIVPALTHEDPRYYTLGYGGFFRRSGYALSRIVLTKSDSGGTRGNISELVGNALEAGLANLYYPPEERSFGNTAQNWATQIEAACLNNVIREFWPDIRRKVLRQK